MLPTSEQEIKFFLVNKHPNTMKILSFALLGMATSDFVDTRDYMQSPIMFQDGYTDQPYCVYNSQPEFNEWSCVITGQLAVGEGVAGEHVMSVVSRDDGLTWEGPFDVEVSEYDTMKRENILFVEERKPPPQIRLACGMETKLTYLSLAGRHSRGPSKRVRKHRPRPKAKPPPRPHLHGVQPQRGQRDDVWPKRRAWVLLHEVQRRWCSLLVSRSLPRSLPGHVGGSAERLQWDLPDHVDCGSHQSKGWHR